MVISKNRIRFLFYLCTISIVTLLVFALNFMFLDAFNNQSNEQLEQLKTSILDMKKIYIKDIIDITIQNIEIEKEMAEISDEAYVTTDDGTYGKHGFVTDVLKELIDSGRWIDFVLAIGPIPMMEAVTNITREHDIKTVVSLNPIMVDGTGMCGGCRVIIDGESKFANCEKYMV